MKRIRCYTTCGFTLIELLVVPPRSRNSSKRQSAFTLIELLVVIAIIAILAAILFPVFAKAREKGRQVSCVSNMKQLGMGIVMYAQDQNEKMPYGYAYNWSNCSTGTQQSPTFLLWWQDLVRPYIKNEQVYMCPSMNPHITYTFGRDGPPRIEPYPLIKDYIANAQGGSYPESGQPFWQQGAGRHGPFINNYCNDSRPLSQIEDPGGTIAIFDGFRSFETWRLEQTDAWGETFGGNSFVGNSPSAPGTASSGHVHKRHNDGFAAAFTDGHAKWMKSSKLGMWTVRASD